MIFAEYVPPTDQTAKLEEKQNIIQIHVISNSVTQRMANQTLLWFLGLQTIFCYNLPRMPKNYLTQLLFDP